MPHDKDSNHVKDMTKILSDILLATSNLYFWSVDLVSLCLNVESVNI